ncbi:hypothetical protein ACSBR2_009666 [Camellia fascicularis]
MARVSMTWSSIPFLNSSPSDLRRVNRHSVMAFASLKKETSSLGVRLTEGQGNLPKVVLTSPHGRCCIQWAETNQHGFARNMNWSIVDSQDVEGNPVVILELKDGPYSRAMWDFSFQAMYKIILDAKSLSTELVITNTDNKPFSFSTALHTYFSASVSGASVKGLKGCKTLNKDPDPKNPLEGEEERDVVTFPGFVDCVYLEAPSELLLDNGLGDKISIRNTSWTDAVLWNPYLQMEACYKDFVCVENAKIGKVELGPNQSWTATQHLSIG